MYLLKRTKDVVVIVTIIQAFFSSSWSWLHDIIPVKDGSTGYFTYQSKIKLFWVILSLKYQY